MKMNLAASLLVLLASNANAFSPSTSRTTTSLVSETSLFQSSETLTREETTTTTTTTANGDSSVVNGLDTGVKKREKIVKEPALWEYNFGLQDPGLSLPHGIVKGATPPEKFELTEEQIRTLEEDGVVHIKSVFDDEWVDYMRKATGYQVDHPPAELFQSLTKWRSVRLGQIRGAAAVFRPPLTALLGSNQPPDASPKMG